MGSTISRLMFGTAIVRLYIVEGAGAIGVIVEGGGAVVVVVAGFFLLWLLMLL